MSVELLAMPQGTEEWRELRATAGPAGVPLIGSSDAPVILGVSPWKTAYQLWREHTHRPVEVRKWQPALDQGNEREPHARMQYELQVNAIERGLHFSPTILLDRERGYIASLDGRSDLSGTQVEFKAPGEKDHALARLGKVPSKYLPQVAWQLYLGHELGDTCSDYVSLAPDGKSIEIVPVPVDAALELYWEVQLLPAVARFREWVTTDTEPPLDEKDRLLVEDIELELLALDLRDVFSQLAPLQVKYKQIEDLLKVKAAEIHPRIDVSDVWITRYKSSGGMDYETAYSAAVKEIKRLGDILGEPVDVPEPLRKADKQNVKVTVRST